MPARRKMSPLRGLASLGAVTALAMGACDFSGGQTLAHTEAGDCASCHAEQAAQWESSAHAVGASSPIFEAYVGRVEEAWGPVAAEQCTSCHAPEHSGVDKNITCISCHAAVGNRGTRDGRLIIDLSQPLAGPSGDLSLNGDAPHRGRSGGFLQSAELCGTCHEVTGPGLLHEPTFSQFKASEAAASGDTCVSCHMPELEPGPVADGTATSRPRRDHRFQGVDPLWGQLGDAAGTTAHWERVRTLLGEALELSVLETADGAVVKLRNVGAGHAVPTGMAAIRDIWVDVTVLDANDTIVGTLPRLLALGDQPMKKGQPVALFTDADEIQAGALGAGDSTAASIDEDVVGAAFVKVQATLRFRSVRGEVLEALGLAALANHVPVLDIATYEGAAASPR